MLNNSGIYNKVIVAIKKYIESILHKKQVIKLLMNNTTIV